MYPARNCEDASLDRTVYRLHRHSRQWDFVSDEEEDATNPFQLPGATDTAASFEFLNEDHTMGNALRYIIMKKFVSLGKSSVSNEHPL